MKIIIYLLAFIIATTTGCTADYRKRTAEDNIREAVYQYQIAFFKEGDYSKGKIFFLSLGPKDQDPADTFMKRFANQGVTVKKRSQASSEITGVMDIRTGASGIILQAREIRWLSESEIEVVGGYYVNGKFASRNTYLIAKQNGRWVVTKDTRNRIS